VGIFLFPTLIEVTEKAVIRHKRSWFSKDEMSIGITKADAQRIRELVETAQGKLGAAPKAP
jgi:hypothetical protein